MTKYFNKLFYFTVSNNEVIQKENSSNLLSKPLPAKGHGFNTKRACLFLFLVALVVRLLILATLDNNYISPDGLGYHALAVNIAKGNGLSQQGAEPFEKSFFREPGYPIFLGGIYSIINLFHPVRYIQGFNRSTFILNDIYPEIIAAKIVQSILGAVSIVLVFLILLHLSNFKIAFWSGLISAIFVQLAFQNMFILRETLVMFLLLLLNWLYLKYLTGGRNILSLTSIGLLIGLLVLVFQIHIIIIPVFFLLTWILSKRLWFTLKHTAVVIAVTALVIAPHCINVYSYYPNIKVLKTFGTSLTHEQAAYIGAQRMAVAYGCMNSVDGSAEWGLSSREQFDRSFNGYYLAKADSLNAMIPTAWALKHDLKKYAHNIKGSVILSGVGYLEGSEFIAAYGGFIGYPLLLFPRAIGLLGILGLFVYGRKYLPYFLPFVTYVLLFWLLGSEYRRMIILQPFYVFFGILLCQYVYRKVKGYLKQRKRSRDLP